MARETLQDFIKIIVPGGETHDLLSCGRVWSSSRFFFLISWLAMIKLCAESSVNCFPVWVQTIVGKQGRCLYPSWGWSYVSLWASPLHREVPTLPVQLLLNSALYSTLFYQTSSTAVSCYVAAFQLSSNKYLFIASGSDKDSCKLENQNNEPNERIVKFNVKKKWKEGPSSTVDSMSLRAQSFISSPAMWSIVGIKILTTAALSLNSTKIVREHRGMNSCIQKDIPTAFS